MLVRVIVIRVADIKNLVRVNKSVLLKIKMLFFLGISFFLFIKCNGDDMTQVDYEASLFFSKINQLDKQEIFDNIKERYLSLNNSLQEGLETFFQQFSFGEN